MDDQSENSMDKQIDGTKPEKMFTLKNWNAVAMWSWDVECDICAICRLQVIDACLRCQTENKRDVLVPALLHVLVGETEQSWPTVPAGMVHTTHGQIMFSKLRSTP